MTDNPRPSLGHSTAGLTAKRPASWADALRDLEPEPAAPLTTGKHCWFDGPHGVQAALLLEWTRGAQGRYRGRVAVPLPDGRGGWAVVEQWVDQDAVRSAYSPPPSSA